MVQCIPAVSVTFKRRWVLLLSVMCAVETKDDCFRYTCAVSVLVSKHFFRYRYRTDAGGIGRYRVPDGSIGLTLVIASKLAAGCIFEAHRTLILIHHTGPTSQQSHFFLQKIHSVDNWGVLATLVVPLLTERTIPDSQCNQSLQLVCTFMGSCLKYA